LKTEVDPKDPFSFEGPDLNKTTGCKIDWKAGKNVTVEIIKKKLKSKNKKTPPKIVQKEEKQDSFFNFFDTPKIAKTDARKVSQLDEENEEDQEELYMIADFEIGQYLREKVIPKAVLYYTGEYDGLEDDYDDYEDEEDEDGEDEEDDDEDDDDDDDDDEDDKPKKGKKGSKGKIGGNKGAKGMKLPPGMGGKGGEPTPSECKQN
jgi:nucleosome assembly protein 1-like 1